MAACRRLETDEILYICRLSVLKLDFAFQTISKTADETTLIDSGATENFIDIEVWKVLNIGQFRLMKTIPVHNMDGSINKNGNINSYVWLKVKLRG